MSLGGLNEIHSRKNERRVESGLPLMTEDTHEICKHMRASSPPASAADLIEQHQQIRRAFRSTKKVYSHSLFSLNFMIVFCLVWNSKQKKSNYVQRIRTFIEKL